MRKYLILLSFFFVLLLSSCGSIVPAPPVEEQSVQTIEETETVAPAPDDLPPESTIEELPPEIAVNDSGLCKHDWIEADCTNPRTCSICGETNGVALGHYWQLPTFETPYLCLRCGAENGDKLPSFAFSRGRFDKYANVPLETQYIGLQGYIAVAYDKFLYSSSDSPVDNDWLSSPWNAATYEKDNQFWNPIGLIEHKTPVKVIETYFSSKDTATACYKGHLLVERCSDGEQFYISITDFIVFPYWDSDDILSAAQSGPFLAVYHQNSDYYPIGGNDKRASVVDGETVLVRGVTNGGRGFGDSKTNPISAISKSGRCYFNVNDLSIVY